MDESREQAQPYAERHIAIRLSDRQIAQVLSDATGHGGIKGLILAQLEEVHKLLAKAKVDPLVKDPKVSHTVMTAVVVLSALTPIDVERGVGEIAAELGMVQSTTHRYLNTWLALGLAEQTATRKYRLASTLPEVKPFDIRSPHSAKLSGLV